VTARNDADPGITGVDNLVSRLSTLFSATETGLTNVALALLVALVGWGVATTVGALTRVLLRAPLQRWRAQPERRRHVPARAGRNGGVGRVLGDPGGGADLALDTMGFTIGAAVTDRLADVLPRVVVSGLLLTLGVLIARLLGSVIRRFFESAGIGGGRVRGQVVTAVLTSFAVLVALEQLGFAAQFVMAVGLVALGAVGIALGLAFGLGCRDLARDFIVEYLRSLDQTGPRRPA
jgi:prepilin signal peptidase PulO-like enzyme (type II secretory pathway)